MPSTQLKSLEGTDLSVGSQAFASIQEFEDCNLYKRTRIEHFLHWIIDEQYFQRLAAKKDDRTLIIGMVKSVADPLKTFIVKLKQWGKWELVATRFKDAIFLIDPKIWENVDEKEKKTRYKGVKKGIFFINIQSQRLNFYYI